jgi:hypothetical protein
VDCSRPVDSDGASVEKPQWADFADGRSGLNRMFLDGSSTCQPEAAGAGQRLLVCNWWQATSPRGHVRLLGDQDVLA